jgi:hypothetical protein
MIYDINASRNSLAASPSSLNLISGDFNPIEDPQVALPLPLPALFGCTLVLISNGETGKVGE